jgi:DNA primase
MSTGKLKGRSPLKKVGLMEEFEKDRLKDSIDIVSLIQSYGIDLKEKGSSWMGLCPFHEDKNPSLSVDRRKGLFNCFGCGAGGDAFDFVMAKEGVEFKEALSILKTFSSVPSEKPLKTKEAEPSKSSLNAPSSSGNSPEDKPPSSQDEPFASLEDVAFYYQRQLGIHPEASDYLKKRGLYTPDLLLRLKAGYSPGDLKEKVSQAQYEELKEAGIFSEKGFETFRKCVVFPLLDPEGRTVGFYGRKVSEKGEVKHLYLKGPHRGLLNRKAASVYREEIILTESVIDGLSLLTLGFQNVIPCYGTNGLTEEHLSLLQDERVKLVTVAFDNDQAGREGSEKIAETLLKEGIPVRLIFPGGGKDWNEVLCTSPLKKEEIVNLMAKGEVRFPKGKSPDFKVTKQNGKYLFTLSDISYRLLGVKELFVNSLRVNIRAQRFGTADISSDRQRAEKGDLNFIDNCDLYSARSRSSFSLHLSRLFGVEVNRIEKDLIRMVEYLEEERDKSLSIGEDEVPELTEEEIKLGMEFLKSDDLFDRIVEDTELLGYVGEEINKILVYLAASSRKLDDPLSVMLMSESASGKSYLIDTVKKLIPPEDVVSLTSISDQALNYFPENGLKHKFLSMGEAVHSEVVEHQIREMLSSHELSRMVTTKDEKTGQMVSRSVRSDVIVSTVMSSTNYDLNAENLSRFFVANADESEEQTDRIFHLQRKAHQLKNILEKKARVPEVLKVHHAAQRLLEQKVIINPLADYLDFPKRMMRLRRDHGRFLELISSICHLRQFQKEEKEEEGIKYIECDLKDYELAYRIIRETLMVSMSNLPQSALLLYDEIRQMAGERAKRENLEVFEVSFSQREVREYSQLGQKSVKKYMKLLSDYEYLQVGGKQVRGSRNSYRLVADEEIRRSDLSLIPTPEEVRERMEQKSKVG